MTVAPVDPFGLDEVEDPLKRDRWSRPLLIPRGKTEAERTAFTRMSTLASFVCDDFGLSTWQQRLLAIGLAEREDLTAMIAALPALNDARCDKTSLTREQQQEDRATKKKLDEYIELALEQAGRNYKANMGTARHGFIENGSSDLAPASVKPDVDSCFEALERDGIEIICSEIFVANDDLMAAGSFDHLLRVPTYGVVVGDVKTGQVAGKGLQFAVQISGYADGEVYDPETDLRSPLESLSGGERINRNTGIVIHVPLGGAKTELYAVNLRMGRHAARLAAQVRGARQAQGFMSPLNFKEKA